MNLNVKIVPTGAVKDVMWGYDDGFYYPSKRVVKMGVSKLFKVKLWVRTFKNRAFDMETEYMRMF